MSVDYDKYIKKYKSILEYAMKYHTDELVRMLLTKKGQRKEIVNLSAAIALRNGIRTLNPKTLFRAVFYHTDHLVDKVEEKWNSAELSEQRKRNKISRYCAAISYRNGLHDDWPLIVEVLKIVGKVI